MPNLPVVFVWGLKATPLLIGAWMLATVSRRASAATRHLVWVLALGGALALPAVALIGPHWEVVVPSLHAARSATPTTLDVSARNTANSLASTPVGSAESATQVGPVTPVESSEPTQSATRAWSMVPSATAIWAIGAAVVGLLLAASLWGTARLAHRSRPEDDPAILDEVRLLARRLSLRRPVRLRRSFGDAMPMTWGVRRPTVLLPAGVDRWPSSRRQAVLLHELAHVKRLDWVTQLMARIVCAVYWWHPLVWVGARRLREERELACDDQVLANGTVPSAYAGDLLEIARAYRASAASALVGVAMARRSQLAGRLLAVLDATRSRKTLKPSHLVPAMGTALLVLIPLAGVATREARNPPTQSPALALFGSERPPALAAPKESVAPTESQARAATLCDWSAGSAGSVHTSSSTSINDEHMMISLSHGDCTITVRADGEIAGYESAPTGKGITFADDDRDIVRLPSGGYFEAQERSGQSRRRVEITERNGVLERRWFVDGSEQTYDDRARAWFGDLLLVLARRAGLNADARAVRIYESQGADGLITEIGQLQSDYVAGKYFRVLFDRATLSSSQLARLLDDAANRIDSDHELGRILATVAAHGPLDADVQRAYVRATNHLDSDYEHGRALSALAATSDLQVGALDAILESADKISSDYERSKLLLSVADRYPAGRPLPATYLRAVGAMSSDHERGRVLSALLKRDQLSADDRGRILRVVETIGSDHTKGEVLVGLIERGRLDEATRTPFFRAVGSIESSYERQRVLTAVVGSGPDDETMVAVLNAARDIDSDHSKAEVLVAAAANGLTSDRARSAYADVAATIQSRYDRNRVYEAAGLRRG
jgi:beta-lactamase regulating signal transducer with metallopeptidase domain